MLNFEGDSFFNCELKGNFGLGDVLISGSFESISFH